MRVLFLLLMGKGFCEKCFYLRLCQDKKDTFWFCVLENKPNHGIISFESILLSKDIGRTALGAKPLVLYNSTALFRKKCNLDKSVFGRVILYPQT